MFSDVGFQSDYIKLFFWFYCTEASTKLVNELQLRDKLSQEISGQEALIAQLVSLQSLSSMQRQSSPKMQNKVISKTSISV